MDKASFKELQAEWYQKLADAGFEDIEDVRRSDAPLKSWHDYRFRQAADVRVETTRAYYERAQVLLHEGRFPTATHRRIWELHCTGLSNRKIAAAISRDPGLTHYQHVKVGYIIGEIRLQMSDIVIRHFIPEMDTALIYSSWPKGVYYGVRPRPQGIPKDIWFTEFFKYAQDTMKTARIFVACMSEDPSTILGYSIISGWDVEGVLEFVYVKGMIRRHGLGRMLVSNKGVTHYRNGTHAGRPFLAKFPDWKEITDGTDEYKEAE